MDSLSQWALGAGIGVAVMGRRTKVWKAALWGGVCGTLPDLDVFIDHGDDVSNMTFHRAQTHALAYLSAVSPLIAAGIARLHRETDRFGGWWLAVWLALVTHPLLDTMTIYGTQLGLPLSDHPYAIGSIFIIDPLYTLPLLLGLIATGLDRRPARLRWNTAGVVVSTTYLVWSMAAQANVANRARESLARSGVQATQLLVTPTAFNTVLWRIVALEGDGTAYHEGFYSLLDGARPVRFARFERGAALHDELSELWAVRRIAWFSHGFWAMREREDAARIMDLRMGQEPDYVFSFRVATRDAAGEWQAADRANVGYRGDARAGLRWVLARMVDPDVPPWSSARPQEDAQPSAQRSRGSTVLR